MNKQKLRKIYASRRLSLSFIESEAASKLISDRFLTHFEFGEILFVHHFLPMKDKNEVDCMLIVNALLEGNRTVRTAAPRVNSGTGELENVEITQNTKFAENEWGILEPTGDNQVEEVEFDLVLVPLLCFDKTGQRVGYGKGFYDRLLAKCRSDCRKIGLSFFGPVDIVEGIHESDIRLDSCVTPESVFDFTG